MLPRVLFNLVDIALVRLPVNPLDVARVLNHRHPPVLSFNRERGIVENNAGLFKKKEERMESRDDKMVSEDLERIVPVSKPLLSASDYKVSVAEPEVREEDATRIVKAHVAEKNRQDVRYNAKVKGEIETRSFRVLPRLSEVSIRGTNLGSVMGKPPTGKKVAVDVIDIARFKDGKIMEHWGVPDQLGVMIQLGHMR